MITQISKRDYTDGFRRCSNLCNLIFNHCNQRLLGFSTISISSADAICVYEKGIRSISQDHFDVCDLVESITLPEAREKSNLLKRIIAKKNLIQYEKRSMYQSEAIEVAKIVTRFYQWVVSHVKEYGR